VQAVWAPDRPYPTVATERFDVELAEVQVHGAISALAPDAALKIAVPFTDVRL
jgi:hypothetical protein